VHELSIAQSLIDAVCEELPQLGEGVAVKNVYVRVGPLSGVVASALAFAFEAAIADSAIAGARLEIEPAEGEELTLVALELVDAPVKRERAPEHLEEERFRGGDPGQFAPVPAVKRRAAGR
jgi:Zn finger protein HypA/HybF involved in hydrogenase expression